MQLTAHEIPCYCEFCWVLASKTEGFSPSGSGKARLGNALSVLRLKKAAGNLTVEYQWNWTAVLGGLTELFAKEHGDVQQDE